MDNTQPAVSVIVPCRNEADHIESCIQSILAQDVPGDYEVIVADGMSDDGTLDILTRLAATDARVHIIQNRDRITPCGMNAGIRKARGRYIAFMGAHNRYAPDYLRVSLEVLQKTGAANVGGSMRCEGESRLQKAIAIAHHSPFSVGGARWHNVNYEGTADTVFGGVYRREVFDRIGLMDEELVRNQDDEFNLRLVRSGGKIWQSPSMKSWYRPRASLSALFCQYKQYGYWKVRVIQKQKLPASARHLVPGLFVLLSLALPLISIWWPMALWLWTALLAAYLVLNVVASLVAAVHGDWKIFPLLPLVFACYHIGYGWGFLRGALDFLILLRRPGITYTGVTRVSKQLFPGKRVHSSRD